MSVFRNKGFTLIELMITLAIAAILLVVGIPSFRDLMIRSRLSGQVQEFYGVINFARSEAIKRGNFVSICKSADGSQCGGNWSDGWIIFENKDNDSPAVRDDVGGANEEPLLRIFPALSSGYTLNANGNFTNYVTFDRIGMANNIGTFVFCANSDETKAKAIVVSKTRPRIATDSDGNGIPNKDDGTDITSCENP